MPVSVQKKFHRTPPQAIERFLNSRISGGLRMIHQQVTVGTCEDHHIEWALWRGDLNDAEVVAHRKYLDRGLAKVSFARLHPLQRPRRAASEQRRDDHQCAEKLFHCRTSLMQTRTVAVESIVRPHPASSGRDGRRPPEILPRSYRRSIARPAR